MYKYDTRLPKPNEYILRANGVEINYSTRKQYLVSKMKAHRKEAVLSGRKWAAEHEIISPEGEKVFYIWYDNGEYDEGKSGYKSRKREKREFVKNGIFNLIADSDGNVITDEGLLAYLYEFRYIEHRQ